MARSLQRAGLGCAIALVVCPPGLAGGVAGDTAFRRFVAAQTASPAPAPPEVEPARAPLHIEVTLEGQTEAIAALVRITQVANARTVNLPVHLRRQMGWYSLPAGAIVDVPVGELRVEACHGLDTEIATTSVRVAAGAAAARARLALRRFYDSRARGFAGGNTHLHLRYGSSGGTSIKTKAQAAEYLATVGQSDGLDLVYVSYLVRTGFDYVSNEFTAADLARLSDPRVRFANGEEFRHEGGKTAARSGQNELRYGHVLFLDLPRLVPPVSYGAIFMPDRPPSDAEPMRRGMREAREHGATIIWCHGRQGIEDVPNWLDGMLDAQNIFDGGSEGTFERVFYPYLNAGLRVPFSSGTDWGVYDFSRAYVALDGAPDSRGYLTQLRAGRSYITNGTLLEFDVEGSSAGDTIELASGRRLRLRGRALGRDDFLRLEVVWNGEVVATAQRREVGAHFEADLAASFEVREPGWLALRLPMEHLYSGEARYTGPGSNLLGKALFAHTSPVYVKLGGHTVRKPEAVQALVADLDAGIREIETKGAFATDAERTAVLALYRNALTALSSR